MHTLHAYTHTHAHAHTHTVETHVDVHGRTYFMDHRTHTMAFEQGRGRPSDISREREMLERRYTYTCTCIYMYIGDMIIILSL